MYIIHRTATFAIPAEKCMAFQEALAATSWQILSPAVHSWEEKPPCVPHVYSLVNNDC